MASLAQCIVNLEGDLAEEDVERARALRQELLDDGMTPKEADRVAARRLLQELVEYRGEIVTKIEEKGLKAPSRADINDLTQPYGPPTLTPAELDYAVDDFLAKLYERRNSEMPRDEFDRMYDELALGYRFGLLVDFAGLEYAAREQGYRVADGYDTLTGFKMGSEDYRNDEYAKMPESGIIAGQEAADGRPSLQAAGEQAIAPVPGDGGVQPGSAATQADSEALAGALPADGAAVDDPGSAGEGSGTLPVPDVRADGLGDSRGNEPDGREGTGGSGTDDAGRRPRSRPSSNRVAREPQEHFHIDDPAEIVGGGAVARFNKNKAAIRLFNDLTDSQRLPTDEERKVLAGYTGWGSFGQELFKGTWASPAPKEGWEERDQWLREEIGQSEWESAQRSIINAHYTDPPTVQAMWAMVERMGFRPGRVLEPSMGIGNFFSMMPRELKRRSMLAGIELDELTGGMAKMLFPAANISIKGYQDSKTPDGFYDLVIGNWPFASQSPSDRRYNKLNPTLHDYFFLKALDQTRPGGLVVGITSKGTMDKVGTVSRLNMAKKAELVAAFRLPSGAFQEYAGTAVVADIIILRRREQDTATPDDSWIDIAEYQTPHGETIKVNQYYLDNPDNVLGTLDYGHGTTSMRPGMIVHRPDDMQAALDAAVQRVPEDAYQEAQRTEHISYVANLTNDREGSIVETDEGLFLVQGEYLAPLNQVKKYYLKDNKKTEKREDELRALIRLRRLYADLIDAERHGKPADAPRDALRAAYEQFTADIHHTLNKSWGLQYMRRIGDPFFPVLSSLEHHVGKNKWKPAKILTESTIRPEVSFDNPTARDAFVLARHKHVEPDLQDIADIAGRDPEEVRAELLESGAIFDLPGGDIVPADIYLSGNVRVKLRQAEAAVESGEPLERNVAALKEALPEDVPYHNIEAQMGATWVPNKYYEEYVAHMLNLDDASQVDVRFNIGRWKVRFPSELNHLPEANAGFGVPYSKVSFKKLVNAAISNQQITVKNKDSDGTVYVDQEATNATSEAIANIRETFTEWIWSDPERRVHLEEEYNEARNSYAVPDFDGSFLGFQGMALTLGNNAFNLREHQVNAIWRGLVTRKSLNAHEVGTGKTFTMGGIALESRRYGIAKKPLLLAHNANSATVAAEINMMYPGAQILYIDNLSPATIKTKLRMIANDDWDVVVMPHSLLDRLALTEETLMSIAREEIDGLEQEAREAAKDEGVAFDDKYLDDPDELKKLRSQTAKELVKIRNGIIESIKKQGARASREGAISFEELGVDMLLVDEAHEFKKPPIITKMRMKGLNTQTSARSIALRFLTRYIRGQNGGGNVHLFTGTPLTNTLTEAFHMQRYIMEEEMADSMLDQWDGWFGAFAGEETDVELTAAGDYENVTRLAKFVNVPELRKMIGQYMDVVFSEDMPEMQPRRTDSGRTLDDPDLTEKERAFLLNGRTEGAADRPYRKVVADTRDMTPDQLEEFQKLTSYAKTWRSMGGKERREAMREGRPESPIITEGLAAKASFDVRMNMPAAVGKEGEFPDHPDSKISRVLGNLLDVYRSDDRATQVVFAEIGIGKTVSRTVTLANGDKKSERVAVFSPIHDLIERLVQGGVPREEIALVTGSTSKEKRKEIAAAMNTLDIRIVLGSTATLGVGVNMQRNLRAMHHLDAPWMPGDLEQRNGRGHRQGNQWNTVMEYRYLTDRLDGRRWQVLAKKHRFIVEFLKAKGDKRVIEGDAASDEQSDILETFAEAAGDPRVLLREKANKRIQKLQRKERLFTQSIADALAKARSLERWIPQERAKLRDLEAVAGPVAAALAEHRGDGFKARITGKNYTSRSEAFDRLHDIATAEVRINGNPVAVGEMYGFDAFLSHPELAEVPVLTLEVPNPDGGTLPVSSNSVTAASIEGVMRGIGKKAEQQRDVIASYEKSLERMTQVSGETFKDAQALKDAEQALADIEQDMEDNPIPPPAWLRNGAPIETEVYWNQKPFDVTGHRYGVDNWYVQGEDSQGAVLIPYLEANDAQGMPLYEEREFRPPEVVESRPEDEGTGEPTPVGYTVTDEQSSEVREPESGGPRSNTGDVHAITAVPDYRTARAQAADTFHVTAKSRKTAEFPIGVERVDSPADAAHVFAPLRKHAQESFMALVLDEGNRPLELIRHSKGSENSAPVARQLMIGAIASVEGAAKVYLGHNHPSGTATPSRPDHRITEQLGPVIAALGMDFVGHIIVGAGGRDAHYFGSNGVRYADVARKITPTAKARRKSLAVTERVIVRRDSDLRYLSTSARAQLVASELGSEDAVILLNTQRQIVGIVTMTPDEMMRLREGHRVRRLAEAIHTSNANAALIKSANRQSARNVAAFLTDPGMGMSVVDWVYPSPTSLVTDPGKPGYYTTELEQSDADVTAVKGMVWFSKASLGKKGSKARGMKRLDVLNEVAEFIKRFPGARPTDFHIYQRQSDYINDPEHIIKAGYDWDNDRLFIIAENLDGPQDIKTLLKHETFVHKGFGLFADEDIALLLDAARETALNEGGELGRIWDEVQSDYADHSEARQAEELWARIAESTSFNPLKRVWHRIVQVIRQILQKYGLIDKRATMRDLKDVIYWVANRLAEGQQPRNRKEKQTAQAQALGPQLFSALLRAAENVKANKATGPQYLAALRKSPGVKTEEIKWSGIEEVLAEEGSMTRDELVELVSEGILDIEVTVADKYDTPPPYREEFQGRPITAPELMNVHASTVAADQWFADFQGDMYVYETDRYKNEGATGGVTQVFIIGSDNGMGQFVSPSDYAIVSVVTDPGDAAYAGLLTDHADILVEESGIRGWGEASIRAQAVARSHELEKTVADEEVAQHEGWVSDTIGLHDNYREVKIKAPNLDPVFVRPAHFPDANILVFTRVTDRGLNAGAMRDTGRMEIQRRGSSWAIHDNMTQTDHVTGLESRSDAMLVLDRMGRGGDERNTYFIDELQSDLHQEGRDKGYLSPKKVNSLYDSYIKVGQWLGERVSEIMPLEPRTNAVQREADALMRSRGRKSLAAIYAELETYVRELSGRHSVPEDEVLSLLGIAKEYMDLKIQTEREISQAPPDAPFKKDGYFYLALKQAILQAVTADYEAIGWASAGMVSERWDKEYGERGRYLFVYNTKIPQIIKKLTGIEPRLMDPDGNDITDTYMDTLREDVAVQLVPDALSGKDEYEIEWGGEVYEYAETRAEVNEKTEKMLTDLAGSVDGYWIIPITRELRERVMSESYPMYARSRRAELAGLTDAEIEQWRKAHKVKNRKGRVPAVQMAAEWLRDGDITSEMYRDIVRTNMPIDPLPKVPDLASVRDIASAISSDKLAKAGVINAGTEIPEGTKVATRLDIPAYDFYGTWVVAVHDGKTTSGKSIGYGQSAVLDNVEFKTNSRGALKIATGQTAKAPLARMFGTWVDMDPDDAHQLAADVFKDDDWIQIGMNPFRHSYFYDKETGDPVITAARVVQVGPLVMAYDVQYGDPDDKRFAVGDGVTFSRGAREEGEPKKRRTRAEMIEEWKEKKERQARIRREVEAAELAAILRGKHRDRRQRALDWARDAKADTYKGFLGVIPRQYMADFAPPGVVSVGRYVHDANAMDARRNHLMSEHAELVETWEKFANEHPEESRKMTNLMYQSTLAGVDPSVRYVPITTEEETQEIIRTAQEQARLAPGASKAQYFKKIAKAKMRLAQEKKREAIEPQISAAWKQLHPDAQLIYVDARDAYSRQRDRIFESLEQRIERTEASDSSKGAVIDILRTEFEVATVQAPYFPLQRFGDYWTAVIDEESDEVVDYQMFEKESEQLRFVEAATARGVLIVSGRHSKVRDIDGAVNAQFAASIMEMMGELNPDVAKDLQDEIWQAYLRMLPELSTRKQFIHRKKLPGYNEDALRTYAHNMFHGAHQLAKLEWRDILEMHLADARSQSRRLPELRDRNKATVLVDELYDRHQWAMNPSGHILSQNITSFGFAWFLGANVSSAAVNLSQTLQIAYPVLGAQFGFDEAAKALVDASKEFIRGTQHLRGSEKLAFENFVDSGVLDKTQAHDLAGVAEYGENYLTNTHKAMSAISWLFHHAEKFNREATALAAYRLARRDGMSHDRAVDYAKDATWMSHYNYANANRPRIMQGDVVKVITLFKQYSLNTTYRMMRDLHDSLRGASPEVRRLARRRFAGIMVMSGILAGLPGLWMIKSVGFVVSQIVDDEDEPFNMFWELRAFLADWLGPTAADAIMVGLVDTFTPVSISQRVSLSDLWFRDEHRDLDSDRQFREYLLQFLGPIPSMIADALRGIDMIADGNIQRGVEKLLPTALEGPAKAARYSQEGVTNWRGDEIVPLSELHAGDLLVQALGFTPSKVNRAYTQNTAVKTYERAILDRRSELMSRLWLAEQAGDPAMVNKIESDIEDYNTVNPEKAITAKSIKQSMRARARASDRMDGGMVLDPDLEYLRDELNFGKR